MEWLLGQLKPEQSRPDRLLVQSITGFDYREGFDIGRASAINHEQDFD